MLTFLAGGHQLFGNRRANAATNPVLTETDQTWLSSAAFLTPALFSQRRQETQKLPEEVCFIFIRETGKRTTNGEFEGQPLS